MEYKKKKLLIINNIGSPDSYQVSDVRRYLREFLMDPQVIQIPWILRFILVYGIISLFRAPKSAEKYKAIWQEKGSPLIVYTQSFIKKLEVLLPDFDIKIGMRYQNPSVSNALKQGKSYSQIVFAPMYPQYAESTTKSAVDKFQSEITKLEKLNSVSIDFKTLKPFWNDPRFIQCWSDHILNSGFDLTNYDVLLFSYHGLPESQLSKNPGCHFNNSCCLSADRAQAGCYRAQCLQTSQLIENQLKTKAPSQTKNLKIVTTFQSRLGKAKWIEPYTDATLAQLAKDPSSRKVLVACPAFTTDCLETLEEIQVENRADFMKHGGQRFDYISCFNDSDSWTILFSQIIKDTSGL